MSERLRRVKPSVMLSLASEVSRIRESGKTVIDLSLGQPDLPAPPHISDAFRQALLNPTSSYSATEGLPELRGLIAERQSAASKVETSPSQIIVTAGSKHAIFVSLLALLDSGDEVLVPEPYFPPYEEIAALVGVNLRTVPMEWSPERVRLDIDKLLGAVTRRTKVILLNYPNNPAGWTLEEADVKKVAEFCSDKGVYLVSDEIYDRIVFDGRQHCPAWAFSKGTDCLVSIGSFSKTYSMVPYRLGYLIAKSGVAREILKVVRATITMVDPYAQKAGCAALAGPQDFVTSRLAKYQERRDRCLQILRADGFVVPPPQGAFYLFVRMNDGVDVPKLANKLLNRESVAVLPGGVFGERWGQFVRMSFATADSDLFTGVQKFVGMSRAT